MTQVPPVVARTLDKSKLQRRELESNYSFPNPYNGGVAIMREHSQTRPQYNQATLLLGKNLIYKARWTTFMYLFMAIKAIFNIEAPPIVSRDVAVT